MSRLVAFSLCSAWVCGHLVGCAQVDEPNVSDASRRDVVAIEAANDALEGDDAQVPPDLDAQTEADASTTAEDVLAPMDASAPMDVRPATDARVPDAASPPTRPAGLPAWVIYTATGGGVPAPVGAAHGTTQPSTVRDERITSTIVIRTPGIYDFANVMHQWAGSGRCIQLENQPPILHIAASNVTVRNFAYRNAPDGIHIGAAVGQGQGYNNQPRIENIVLDHVTGYACEDALTTQYNSHDITIENSWFHGNPNTAERDKLLQLNFANNIRILGTTFVNSPRCVRFKGGAIILIEGSRFDGCDDAVRGDTTSPPLGLIPTTASVTTSRRSSYRNYANRTFSADGRITINSESDTFDRGPRFVETNGGRVNIR
ncbi:MAG: hypothetical protein Q8Q09_00420 [Deltaproteobacteria bacterium]|nr:hypothetical protein [Deltaproteobacteria bacterium]